MSPEAITNERLNHLADLLEKVYDRQEQHTNQLTGLEIKVASLETRSKIWGATGGLLASALAGLAAYILKN